MDAVAFVELVGPELQTKRPDRQGAGAPPPAAEVLLLQLSGFLPFPTNPRRWRYGWVQADVDGNDFGVKSDGLTSSLPTFGLALNCEERKNTPGPIGTTSYGIPNNPGIGKTVEPLPIPAGSIVPAMLQTDADTGLIVPVFAATNALLIGCG